MIKVESITRKYGDVTAVDGVSFEIVPGEIVGLLGHNGAGKTTIMKMITGYLEPTEGTISIDGLDIGDNRQEIQKKIGYLPENCPVYPEMSILGYLEYSATLHGVKEQERPELIRNAVSRTGLADRGTNLISTLSRGYRQRTGVAQALLHNPGILILDEPTNGLDPTQIQQMRTLITDLAKNATVIISTHILQEVQAICDRVIIIKDGGIALDSRLDELTRDTKLLVTTDAGSEKAIDFFTSFSQIASATEAQSTSSVNNRHIYELKLANGADKDDSAATISKNIHSQGWQLYDLHFEARNLETVFAEISA